jgi:hypothetical protein
MSRPVSACKPPTAGVAPVMRDWPRSSTASSRSSSALKWATAVSASMISRSRTAFIAPSKRSTFSLR